MPCKDDTRQGHRQCQSSQSSFCSTDNHVPKFADGINDSEEIVVKPLSGQLKGIPVYSGITIMGDGQVALILNVMGLAHSANVISDRNKGQTQEYQDRTQSGKHDHYSLLVAGIGPSHRFAVELGTVF